VLISNAVDESDGGRLWNDTEEDGNVRRVREDEGTGCEDRDIDTDW